MFHKPVSCDTCRIKLNSEMQAQQHFSGKAHNKMLRKRGLPVPEEHQAKIARTGAHARPMHAVPTYSRRSP